ncbi:MAG: tetratricopeptide repeat protein [Opitutaceae bacterium]|nr:tetratricopeptide repeat protein [Opitutaceae bacterium]
MIRKRPIFLASVLMLVSARADPHSAGHAAELVAPSVTDPVDGIPLSAAAPYLATGSGPGRPGEITEAEIKSFLRIGDTKTAQGDYDSAEIAYRQVLAARATPEQDRDALLGLARMYRRNNELTRSAAVYEKLLKEFPADNALPIVYLELGRVHRALGAYRLAIARFYSVINSTLKLPANGQDLYRQLARTAQFEVAETHFLAGEFQESAQYFSRLKLLDLTPADQARAHFKSAFSLNRAGDYENAAASLRSFLEQYPSDENTPEARYLLSISLRRLGRDQESLAAALDLLKAEHSRTAEDPKRWAYWQRKTGNQLANEFYEQGDANSALTIYLSLAALSSEPMWRLPVLYQVALCYERLRSGSQAREYLQTVAREAGTPPAGAASTGELAELANMATWRLQQLDWEEGADRQLNTFFQTSGSPNNPVMATTPVATPHS